MTIMCAAERKGPILPMVWRDTPALLQASWCGKPKHMTSMTISGNDLKDHDSTSLCQ